jgi:hypothetical protein
MRDVFRSDEPSSHSRGSASHSQALLVGKAQDPMDFASCGPSTSETTSPQALNFANLSLGPVEQIGKRRSYSQHVASTPMDRGALPAEVLTAGKSETELIPQEQRMVRIKGIFKSLVMFEKRCMESNGEAVSEECSMPQDVYDTLTAEFARRRGVDSRRFLGLGRILKGGFRIRSRVMDK